MLRIVKTENGTVRGIPAADPRITAFKGIPFAAPPVGNLRWREPQPAANWEGIRNCYEFGPICMQSTPGADPNAFYSKEWHVDPKIPMSEDCLYLNIWTNAKTGNEKMPVMVWFFGGAFQGGYTGEMEFDGERIARRDVILVSVNYRCNVFGFLTHPELIAESPDGCYGNYGVLDQKAGLEWVKRNISAFGGDPNNVTIFGQSAGAGSVLSQITSPMTKGLFHKAIMQSGGGLRAYGQATPMIPFDKAKENGIGFFKALGVNSLAEARALDAKTVLEKGSKFGFIATWSPTVDGRFLPEEPSEAIMNNHHHDIPYLYGNTGGEYDRRPRSLSELKDFAESTYGEHADEFIRLCNVSSDEELKALTDKDDSFKGRCVNNILFIEKQLELGRKGNFLYYFNPEMPGSDNVGCFHSSDLWFEFETLAKCWRPFKGKHYDLARKMCNYWTNFAKFGNPNGTDADGTPMHEWREYTKDDPFIIYLSDEIGQYNDIYSPLMKFRCDYLFGRL